MSRLFAVLAVLVVLAGGWATYQTVTFTPAERPPEPACNWDHQMIAVCVVPTPGKPVVIHIRGFEDGSAHTWVASEDR